MQSKAIVFEKPEKLVIGEVEISTPGPSDVVVDMEWTGISTGTERLLWTGRMPDFPGMGYPLVPGYESVGRISKAGELSGRKAGERVFVPGASCYGAIRGLFGGASSRVVVDGAKTLPLDSTFGEQGTLLALAATARHAVAKAIEPAPDLIIGHGVLGRLIARLAIAAGGQPVVWETNPARHSGAEGYEVLTPDADPHRSYRTICDVSGDASILNELIGRLATGGEIVLAGFYEQPISFAFPPAFMRGARISIAAQWRPADLATVKYMIETGRLSLDGLITHRRLSEEAKDAYRVAFEDPGCLKMILDWRLAS